MQPHPHPQLPNPTRPPVRQQRTLRRDRRPTRRHRVLERRKKRIPLSRIDKPTLARDRGTNQLVMHGQHPRPTAPKLPCQPSRTLDISEQQGNQTLRRTPRALHGLRLTPHQATRAQAAVAMIDFGRLVVGQATTFGPARCAAPCPTKRRVSDSDSNVQRLRYFLHGPFCALWKADVPSCQTDGDDASAKSAVSDRRLRCAHGRC